jgi:small nuclear ribonucleoprotein (snRNP)-like protein
VILFHGVQSSLGTDWHFRLSFAYEVVGVLKGFDQLLNLVLDDVKEEVIGEPCIRVVSGLLCLIKAFRARTSHSGVGPCRCTRTHHHLDKPSRRILRNRKPFPRAAIKSTCDTPTLYFYLVYRLLSHQRLHCSSLGGSCVISFRCLIKSTNRKCRRMRSPMNTILFCAYSHTYDSKSIDQLCTPRITDTKYPTYLDLFIAAFASYHPPQLSHPASLLQQRQPTSFVL